jgi:probable phosphomutase (TIGR03848 family)
MLVTTIVLLRHATTAATGKRLGGWTPGVHLDDAGVAQAEAAADRLAELPVAAVYASPLERTQETAKHVARRHGLRVRTRRAVGEVDYGEWTDRPLAELRRLKLWKVVQHTPSRVTFPGGESIRGAQQRAVDALEDLAAEHADDTIVVVSHADVIKAVLAHHLGMPLDTFQRLHVAPASVSVLHLTDGAAPVVARINDHGPLAAPPRRPGRRGRRATTERST